LQRGIRQAFLVGLALSLLFASTNAYSNSSYHGFV
jgi:hypothetical protein